MTEIFGVVSGDLATSLLKGKHLFVSRMWSWVNQPPPKDAPAEVHYDFTPQDVEKLSAMLKISQSGSEALLKSLPVKDYHQNEQQYT